MAATRRGLIGAGLAAALLAACSFPKPDESADKAARLAYEQLRNAQYPALEARLDPKQNITGAGAVFAQLHGLLPPGEPTSSKQISWNSYSGTGGSRLTLVHVYTYPEAEVTATTVLTPGAAKGQWLIAGLHVTRGLASNPVPMPGPAAAPAPAQNRI